MADLEIELPMISEQLRLRESAPGISTTSAEKQLKSDRVSFPPASGTSINSENSKMNGESDHEESQQEEDNGDGEIAYHYLTEATQMPHPTSVTPSKDGQKAPPVQPDIKEYTSPFDGTVVSFDCMEAWVAEDECEVVEPICEFLRAHRSSPEERVVERFRHWLGPLGS
ncbi:hypothetical protein CC80DRAFT_490608 [Byssothecium circinans]|uniref:Uncharacterized protein n=1 Tax=Byssothecium circinans TaxID=147558 RepID=A0A6A5UCI1_9PLEO|nr:hypothetical protein CC80DRAFT_490608 [Byssothecium circinans]